MKHILCPDGQNNLLATLSRADLELIEPHLTPVSLTDGMVIEKPDRPTEHVVFPVSGVGSIIALGAGGRSIEAGLFGRDGMSGVSVLLGVHGTPHETRVQVPGSGVTIAGEKLRELLGQSVTLHQHLLRFVHTLMIQMGQTALSNGQAKLEERLARWLLMCHDRVRDDRIRLTHEFLSVMLGVRRAGVTVGTHLLEGKGLIRAARGEITILDREGLEIEAKGSYGVAEAEYARLLGSSAAETGDVAIRRRK